MSAENVNTSKKPRESDRRRRRRKQNKNKSDAVALNATHSPQQVLEHVEVEHIPEKAQLDGFLDDEFRKVFEKFTFKETAAMEENDKREEAAANAGVNKKVSSDSEEEDQDTQVKDKGAISNKKKKLERRMKIAQLKQISARPDVVEVWDATSADPKLLVLLKSYRNTVPVPRHWCQKRKFLQGNGCDNLGAWTWEAWY